MKIIGGGVCAAKGYKASGCHVGVRKNKTKKDVALILSDCKASAAAVYTQNLVKGAPLTVTKENISDGYARAVICNSGNANTCNANGIEIAQQMCGLVSSYCNIDKADVVVASTGVIGQQLSIEPFKNGMEALTESLSYTGNTDAAEAIMTTDTVRKEYAVSFTAGGRECRLGGMAKGSGMIHPNMATLLVFLTTDAAISPEMLRKALREDVADTFNMISVDGDTSTNDMAVILANGLAGNDEITCEGEDYTAFAEALNIVTTALCKMLAKDGEGATKLLECRVDGACCNETAKTVAKSIIKSSLFKSAMFGADANWGRVLCAIGYSGADVDVNKIDVSFSSQKGSIDVCREGMGIPFSEEKAKEVLSEDEIVISVGLNSGSGSAVAWGCDLTYDYVKINGDYRT